LLIGGAWRARDDVLGCGDGPTLDDDGCGDAIGTYTQSARPHRTQQDESSSL